MIYVFAGLAIAAMGAYVSSIVVPEVVRVVVPKAVAERVKLLQ